MWQRWIDHLGSNDGRGVACAGLVDDIGSCCPKTRLLFHQFFIQCHGFDMREDSMSWFQSKIYERFPGDAGDKWRSDIQEHVYR